MIWREKGNVPKCWWIPLKSTLDSFLQLFWRLRKERRWQPTESSVNNNVSRGSKWEKKKFMKTQNQRSMLLVMFLTCLMTWRNMLGLLLPFKTKDTNSESLSWCRKELNCILASVKAPSTPTSCTRMQPRPHRFLAHRKPPLILPAPMWMHGRASLGLPSVLPAAP